MRKTNPPKTIKEIREENKVSDTIIRDLRALYESNEDYYEPKKIKSAFHDNYVEYESNVDKDKRLSIEEYFNMIRPYLSNTIEDHKDEWKIQLTMEISLIFIKDSSKDSSKDSKDFRETYPMHMHS